MSKPRSNTSTDPLQIMIQQARAIINLNKENLAFIQSCSKNQDPLSTEPSSAKKQKTEHQPGDPLLDTGSTENVDDVILSWRYKGESLTKEKIAIDDFVNREFEGYEDLERLQGEYDKLLGLYSRVLADAPESWQAVKAVLKNVALLQAAIREIHKKVLDAVDSDTMNDAMALLMKDQSRLDAAGLVQVSPTVASSTKNQSKMPRSKPTTQTVEDPKEVGIVEFGDCTQLACKYTFAAHEYGVDALESYVMNNESVLLSASADRNIKIWNLTRNTLVSTLTGHTDKIHALVKFFKNGMHMLASGSFDNTIKLWDLSRNVHLQTLFGHSDWIMDLILYEKGGKTILISASADYTIKLWDLDNYTVIATLQCNELRPYRLSSVYTNNGRSYLASGGIEGEIIIWSLDDYLQVKTIKANIQIIALCVVDLVGKKILASGAMGGMIRLWSLDDYNCIHSFPAHPDCVLDLTVFQCNGKVCMASTGRDKTIKVWNMQDYSCMVSIDNDNFVARMKVFMNGNLPCLATGHSDGNIKLWTSLVANSNSDDVFKDANVVEFADCTNLVCKHTLGVNQDSETSPLGQNEIYALQSYVANSETFLLSAGRDKTIKHWNLSNNTLAALLTGHSHFVTALAIYVRNGVNMLASGSLDETIKIWDLSTNTEVQSFDGHKIWIESLAVYEKDGKPILVSGGMKDNSIRLWDLDNYTILKTLQGGKDPAFQLCVYTHNKRMYLATTGSEDKKEKVKIWSLDSFRQVKNFNPLGRVNSLVAVEVGGKKLLASGNQKGGIKLWSLDDYKCIQTIRAHTDIVYSLNVLQCNGKVCLVSSGNDGTVKIWNLEDYSVMQIINDDSMIRATRVVVNGEHACLASGDDGGKVKLWME